VLAADDDVGEAEVLPVNGVHDRLLRPGVEHLMSSPADQLVGQVVAGLLPQLFVLVALAEGLFSMRPW